MLWGWARVVAAKPATGACPTGNVSKVKSEAIGSAGDSVGDRTGGGQHSGSYESGSDEGFSARDREGSWHASVTEATC